MSNKYPRAVFAGRQNYGYGQKGRFWDSPRGGVWTSAALIWPQLQSSASIFGLTVAVALAERLELKGIPIRIKWPNDLMICNRKLAGLLPKLVYRGSRLLIARMGLGLNLRNRVPDEGIALVELLNHFDCCPTYWSSEVLIAFDRAMNLAESPAWIASEVENRLWSDHVKDPETGEIWEIDGVALDGALKLQKGSRTTIWHRCG